MDINVNVTIGLAQPVHDLIKRVFSGFSLDAKPQQEQRRAEVLPVEQQTESNEIETASTEADNTQPVAQIEQEPETVDIATVRDIVSELVRSGKKPQIQELLTLKGVTGYSQLNSEDLNEFYNTIKQW